jgi:hypothetical protein
MSALAIVCLAISAPARAGDAMKDAVATLPENSVGFACVPSLKALDGKLQRAVADLGLQGMIPPTMSSIVGSIKMFMPFLQGMDENGPLALVLLPADTIQELGLAACIFIPAEDPKDIIQKMGGQPAEEGGVWNINFFGQPQFASVAERRLIIAQSAANAKRAAESKGGLDKKLKPAVLDGLAGLDKAIWLDTSVIFKLAGGQIQQMLGVMVAMQSAQGPMGARQAEAMQKQINTFTEGAASFAFGLAFEKSGLDLRAVLDARPGTELHKQMQVKPTKESLIRGLPAEKYLVAFGQRLAPEQAKASLEYLDPYLDGLKAVEGIEEKRIGEVKALLSDWAPMSSAVRGTVTAVGGGSNGLLGFSAVIETTDAKKWIELSGKAVALVKSIIDEAKGEDVPAEIREFAAALSFTPDTEDVAGAKLAHLKFDVSKLSGIDEEWPEQLETLVGKEGLLVRFAPVDAQQVAVTFGGGSTLMSRLVEAARSNATPLESDAGIRSVGENFASERTSVMYFAVDRIVGVIKAAQNAFDEEELPISMPELNAPLTINGTGGDGWSRGDLFLPTELMVAIKNAVLTMMGGGQAPPPPGAPSPPGAGG